MGITSLGMNIFTTYSGRGINAARRDVRRLEGTLVRMNRVNESFNTAGLNAFKAAVVATAPALITLGQGAVFVGGAVAAMGVSAGAAGGIFGAVMAGAIKRAFELKKAGKALSQSQKGMVTSVGALRGAWNKFLDRVSPKVLHPASTAVRAIARNIGKLRPLIAAVGPLALRVSRAFARWMDSEKGFKRFIGTLRKHGVPALDQLHKAARNTLAFLGRGFRAFAPEGVKMAKIINKGARALNFWSKAGGFQRFIKTVKANGPQIREFFRALGGAISQVGKALGGMAMPALRIATILLQIVAAMPVGLIQALAYAYIFWRLQMAYTAAKIIILKVATGALSVVMRIATIACWAFALATGRSAVLVNMATVAMIRAKIATIALAVWQRIAAVASRIWAAAIWLVNIAMRANPIILIVTLIALLVGAIVWAATRTRFFQTVWAAVWGFVKRVGLTVWAALRTAWRFTVNAIMAAFRWIGKTAPAVWRAVWGFIRKVASKVWGGLRAGWRFTVRIVMGLFRFFGKAARNVWRTAWSVIRKVAKAVWGALRAGWRFTVRIVMGLFRFMSKAARGIWKFMWGAIRKVAKVVWNFLKGTWRRTVRVIMGLFRFFSKAARNIWKFAWNAMKKVARGIWNFLKGAWRRAVSVLMGLFRFFRKNASRIWKGVWNFIRDFARKTWNNVKKGVTGFVKAIRNSFRWVVGVVKKIWGGLKKIVAAPVRFFVNTVYNKGLKNAWNNTFAKIPGVKKLPSASVGFAQGGKIPGSGDGRRDRVPIMAAPGEYMLRRAAVKRIGVQNLDAMNTGRMPGPGAGRKLQRQQRQHAQLTAGFGSGWKNHATGGTIMPMRGMFLGGLLEDVGGFVKNIGKIAAGGFGGLGSIGTGGGGGFDWAGGIFTDVVGKLTEAFFKPFKGAIGKIWEKFPGIGMWGKYVHGVVMQGIKQLIDFLFSIAQDPMSGFHPFRPWQEGDGRKVNFHGITVNFRTMKMLQKAQKIAKKTFQYFQGSFSSSVAASAGTHSGGGAVDLGPTSNKNVGALRASGFAAWNRGKKWGSGSFSPHIHAIAVGDKQLSGAARGQVRQFFNGGDGLGGKDNWVGAAGGGPGGRGVQRWRGMAMRAMRMGGLRVTGYTVGRFLSLMRQESGGNPRAVNGWDSNARAGNASRGLMQVVPTTFRANHVRGTSNNIFDPLANMAAAARYIKRRYGGRIPNAPYALGGLINQMMNGGMVNSFDKGGMLPMGLSLAYNGTGAPEPVGHGLGGGETHLHVHGNVYVKSKREFEDMVVEAVSNAENKGRIRTRGTRRGA